MAGIYYNPDVWDWGGKFAQGGLAGMAFAKGMQEVQSNKRKMDMEQRIDAANAEIAEVQKGLTEKLKAMPKIDEAPAESQAGTTLSPAIAEQRANPESLVEETGGLARQAAQREADAAKGKRGESIKSRTDLLAEATKARHDIYIKHSLPELADKLKTQHIAEAAALSKNVGKNAGLSFLQKGPLADYFEGVGEDDIDVKDYRVKVEHLGPNKDGVGVLDLRTKEFTWASQPTAKEEKDDKESWAGFGYGQMKNLKTGEIVKVPTVPREGGGSKADAKKEWTKGDVRQEYNNLNGYLNKVESDLAKQIETEGESADLSEQLAKVRNIRKGLMKYRSDDEWSVSDENSSERGKYPRNLQKIADYLAGFGEQEKPKDITQMKPTAKGSATGKVRKPLDDIL